MLHIKQDAVVFSSKYSEQPVHTRPFFHSDSKLNLEKMIHEHVQDHDNNLLDNLFSNKSKVIKSTIKSLLSEIDLREKLDCHILDRINQDLHWQQNQLEGIHEPYITENLTEICNLKMKLENNILDLEKEKRNEYIECWKDLMLLKKMLMSAFREYWDFFHRKDILINNEK